MKTNLDKPIPSGATMGDVYRPAMEIQTQEEADVYFKRLVEHMMSHGKSQAEAEDIERQNLGYFAGYYDDATRSRVERLFSCAHPVFGKIANGKPTPEEALAAGVAMAQGKD